MNPGFLPFLILLYQHKINVSLKIKRLSCRRVLKCGGKDEPHSGKQMMPLSVLISRKAADSDQTHKNTNTPTSTQRCWGCVRILSVQRSVSPTQTNTHTTARCARPNQVNVNVHQLESEGGAGGGLGRRTRGSWKMWWGQKAGEKVTECGSDWRIKMEWEWNKQLCKGWRTQC